MRINNHSGDVVIKTFGGAARVERALDLRPQLPKTGALPDGRHSRELTDGPCPFWQLLGL